MSAIALVLAVILFAAGLIGTVLPVLPGPILVYLGMLLYGFMTDFATLDAYFFTLQALAMVAIFAVDYVASAVGTRMFGGSKRAAIGAIVGTVLGLIFLGPIGIILGPFAGAILVEVMRGAHARDAIRAGIGTVVGTLGGTLVKLAAEVVMIVYFFKVAF